MLEHLLSEFLAKLIDVPNYEQSYSFRNKQGALSFDQKVSMLIDIGALNREDKERFKIFMEVRNQFMHNLQASSYVEVFNFLDDKKKKVLALCPDQKDLTEEQKLRAGFNMLSTKVLQLTVNILKAIQEKMAKTWARDYKSQLSDELLKQISESTTEFVEPVIKNYEKDNMDMPAHIVRSLIAEHNKSVISAATKLAGTKNQLKWLEDKLKNPGK